MATETIKYHVLTPKTDLENTVYFGAIDYALKDKSMHNLAISGPYGAGKSSVIHSYINKRKTEKSRVVGGESQINDITITLAHIRTNTDDGDGINPNLIEYSILEQLFFHECGTNLPESQFSRIKPLSLWDLFAYVFYIVFFGACIFAWFYRNTLGLDYPGYLALLIFSALSSYAVYKLLPLIRNLTVRKISLATASIEVGKDVEQSVLNKHLDEILYFFQQTGTNMVVFEDLDRFDNPDLFVKLREINYLINNAATVEQDVVFVYALRDDMFLNRQRTKFFDFIVPIIPFVDGKNAVDKLYSEIEEAGIDASLCQVLSHHVGEMRMVYNIVNEYNIYQALKAPDAQYDENRLLAIVAYKNCFPKDFAALLDRKGILYTVMTKKGDVIQTEREDLNAKIAELEGKLQSIQAHHHSSIQALRLEYINALLNAIPHRGARLGAFSEIFSLEDWASDDLFKKLMTKTSINYVYPNHGTGLTTQAVYNYKFQDIEKIVDTERSYKERAQFIQDREHVDEIEKEIENLRSNVAFLDDSKYVSLLDDGHSIQGKFDYKDFKDFVENKDVFAQQVELIEDLLSFDYINENYMEYVSLFHSGTLGPNDNRFLIDVLRHKHNDYGYKLEKAYGVVDKMGASLFIETSAWWNFDLVDAMLSGAATREKIDNMVACLSDTDEHLRFINEYIKHGGQQNRFVEELCNKYTNIWRDLKVASYIISIDKERWIELIIRNTTPEHIVKIIDKNEPAIANMSSYFHIQNIPIEHLYSVASVLEVKFTSINLDELEENKEFIVNNELYAITPEMLRCVLSVKDNDKYFEMANYTYLRNSGKNKILEYVEKNLNEYVQNVLLASPTNVLEKAVHESALLASNDLAIELKERLIKQGMGKWDSVNQWDVQTKEIQLMLYKYNRIKVTWENILYLYTLDQAIFIEYIQSSGIVKQLKAIGKPDFRDDEREKWEEMQNAIVANQSLSNITKQLVDCFDVAFEHDVIKDCSKKLLHLLIDKDKVAYGVNEYSLLHHVDRYIALHFFVEHYENYKEHVHELDLDEYDVQNLFYKKFSLTEKQKLHLLANINTEAISKYNSLSIIKFLLLPTITKIDVERKNIRPIVNAILFYKEVPTIERIRLFDKYPLTDDTEIGEWILTFSENYLENGRLHRIPYSPEAYTMCTYLMNIGYLINRQWNRKRNWIVVTYPTSA